jgi:hypothetical protein
VSITPQLRDQSIPEHADDKQASSAEVASATMVLPCEVGKSDVKRRPGSADDAGKHRFSSRICQSFAAGSVGWGDTDRDSADLTDRGLSGFNRFSSDRLHSAALIPFMTSQVQPQ